MIGALLLTVVCAISPKDFFGRYQSPEAVRIMSDFYDDTQTLICTVSTDNSCVDFLIDESDELRLITIECKNVLLGKRYQTKTYDAFPLSREAKRGTNYYAENAKIDWDSNYSVFTRKCTPVYWALLDADCLVKEEYAMRYVFTFQDQSYALYIKE